MKRLRPDTVGELRVQVFRVQALTAPARFQSMASPRLPSIFCLSSVIRHLPSRTRHLSSVIGHLSVICHLSSVIVHVSSAIGHLSSHLAKSVRWPKPDFVHRSTLFLVGLRPGPFSPPSFVFSHLSSVICHLPFVFSHPSSVICHRPSICHLSSVIGHVSSLICPTDISTSQKKKPGPPGLFWNFVQRRPDPFS